MIELKDIACSFIFKNLNLEIKKGEFVVIIGDNGAGKSSLMNLICGNLLPADGKIFIDNIDVTKKKEFERAEYISYVFQDPKLGTNEFMTVRENLSLALNKNNFCVYKRAIDKNNDLIFRDLIDFDLDKLVSELSGGQRQKLCLIMAVINMPKILLLDEHTAALDINTSKEIMEMTNKIIRQNNLTAVMITHNLNWSVKYGDRLIFMHEGKIKADISGKRNLEDIIKLFETD